MCYNVLKSCATRVCCACGDEIICVAVQYLTLRTGYEKHGRKNPLPFPLFRSGHMSVICARLRSKGKVGVQRGRETAGVPSFLPPRRVPHSPALRRAQLPAEVQQKTLRPSGANPLTQFEYPAQPVQKKVPPVRVNRLRGSSTPLSRCRKRCRLLGANTPAAVRAPHSAGAEFTNRNFRHFRR